MIILYLVFGVFGMLDNVFVVWYSVIGTWDDVSGIWDGLGCVFGLREVVFVAFSIWDNVLLPIPTQSLTRC